MIAGTRRNIFWLLVIAVNLTGLVLSGPMVFAYLRYHVVTGRINEAFVTPIDAQFARLSVHFDYRRPTPTGRYVYSGEVQGSATFRPGDDPVYPLDHAVLLADALRDTGGWVFFRENDPADTAFIITGLNPGRQRARVGLVLLAAALMLSLGYLVRYSYGRRSAARRVRA
jgi:hypothetical protein